MVLRKKYSLLFGTLFLLSGCSTVPEEMSPAKAALLAEPPREFSSAAEIGLRKRMTFIEDTEINNYLTKITGRLFTPGKYPISMELVNATSVGYAPSIWVVPGGNIFVDIRVLRSMHFENELAAAIALAWSRSEGTEFRERMIEMASSGDPDPEKIWTFGSLENQKAIEPSVARLYRAGYDPRGLITYFDRVSLKSKMRPDSDQDLLKDKVRRAIALYAPLINPTVRTEEFYKMQKRLDKP